MKKAISLLLCVIMALSSIMCADISALAQDDATQSIVVETEYTSTPSDNGGKAGYTFVPEISGEYIFVAKHPLKGGSFSVEVYNAAEEKLNRVRSKTSAPGNSFVFSNTFDLTAGEQYRIVQKTTISGEASLTVYYHPEHTFKYSTSVKPNCGRNGYNKYICSYEYCDAEKTEEIAATDEHYFQVYTVKPTCIDYGCVMHKCVSCGFYYETDYVSPDPSAHSYTTDGYCKHCYEPKYPDNITELDLQEGETVNLTKPRSNLWCSITPSESGYYSITSGGSYDLYAVFYNSRFDALAYADDISAKNYNFRISAFLEKGEKYYIEIGSYDTGTMQFTLSFSAHTHKMTTEVVKSDCGTKGYTRTECECGYYYISDVKEKSGSHKYSTEVIAPTCAEGGYTLHYCEVCDASFKSDYTEPTGAHNYNKGICEGCGALADDLSVENSLTLTENSPLDISFDSQNSIFFAEFTPSETATYNISSEGLYDIDAVLLDKKGELVDYDKNSGKGLNFRLSAQLTAGQTYIVTAFTAADKQGSFSIIACKHTHSFNAFIVPATCVDSGYTRYSCTDCARSFEADFTEPTYDHHYVNGLCPVCLKAEPKSENIIDENTKSKRISNYMPGLFIFTPKHSGTMTFSSSGSLCPDGDIFIEGLETPLDIRQEPTADMNFRLSVDLEAGKTYYFTASAECTEYDVHFDYEYQHDYETVVTKASLTSNGRIVTKCIDCGAVLKTVTISKPSSFKLSSSSYVYDGKVKKPTVIVKDAKGNIIPVSNYTVHYPNGRKNVGKYDVAIVFKGNYSGITSLSFTIKPKATTISSLNASSKAFTVKWKKQATQVTGYQIQYSKRSDFKSSKTVTVSSAKTTSKKITKLTSKKKYYVRIRTYKISDGVKYYSTWSKSKSVTTKK